MGEGACISNVCECTIITGTYLFTVFEYIHPLFFEHINNSLGHNWLTHLSHKCPTHLSHGRPTHLSHGCPIPVSHWLNLHFMYGKFHMMNIDVPAGVGAPPLDTHLQLYSNVSTHIRTKVHSTVTQNCRHHAMLSQATDYQSHPQWTYEDNAIATQASPWLVLLAVVNKFHYSTL